MCVLKLISCLCLILNYVMLVNSVELYHINSRLRFSPDETSEYFGYTVVLTDSGLLVGAPKAASRRIRSSHTGQVFVCKFSDLTKQSVTCNPLAVFMSEFSTNFDFDDMWYGATILSLPQNQILVCAPRWQDRWSEGIHKILGGCFTHSSDGSTPLVPLHDPSRNFYKVSRTRPEYIREDSVNHYYYTLGQAGMSAKVVDKNRFIIGAPGILGWTGSIVEYDRKGSKDPFRQQPISNPYFTRMLMPDDYFGYSVESGTFDNTSGVLYVAGAPRSQMGFGGVMIFNPPSKEEDPIRIRSLIKGPHLGSYFGAVLCSTDLNMDGRSDLLVGAPTYTMRDGKWNYDQGAVFVYLSSGEEKTLTLISSDIVMVSGSSKSGARFGSAIADLGDVDGDSFRDIAIGAPFEDDGAGAVYIYRGNGKGIREDAVQRITAAARGFGFSISKGYDVDGNHCNDLAVGALNSGSAFLYRCIPTVKVDALIVVPDVVDLSLNTANFKVTFCVAVAKSYLWPRLHIGFKAKIRVDTKEMRAMLSGNNEYKVTMTTGDENCKEQTVKVKPKADLSRPITLNFYLEHIQQFQDSTKKFDSKAIRMSEDSKLETDFKIQLTSDCGEDMVCKPLLVMYLILLDRKPYIPGTDAKLGAKVIIINKEEPAFGAKVHLTLPLPPKRLPENCILKELNVTCDVPAPLRRNEVVTWDFELEYTQMFGVEEKQMKVTARIDDAFYSEYISDSRVKEVVLRIVPSATFAVNGKPLPNATVPVSREKFNDRSILNVVHYYQIINYGPSDWTPLTVEIRLPKNVSLSYPIQGCDEVLEFVHCSWSAPAKVSLPIRLTLRVDINHHGEMLEEKQTMNLTTSLYLDQHNKTAFIMSTLVLEPAPPMWPFYVGLATGCIVLGAIIYGLYRCDFFSRQRHERLRLPKDMEMEENELYSKPGSSIGANSEQQYEELLCDFD